MKKMKKVISILLILTFAVSLAACGGGGQTADNGEYITVTELECGVKIFTLSLLGIAEAQS